MKKLFMVLLFSCSVTCLLAKNRKDGYYVNTNNDTVQCAFKNTIFNSINLKGVRDGIWYFDINNEQTYLRPDFAKYVKIYDSVNGDVDFHSIKRRGPNIFVRCIEKGRLSLYVSQKSNVSIAPFLLLNMYMESTDLIYYFTLNDGQAVSNGGKPFDSRFWRSYLKNYPDFIECLTWDKKMRREMKAVNVECDFRTKNFQELAQLFNEKYP